MSQSDGTLARRQLRRRFPWRLIMPAWTPVRRVPFTELNGDTEIRIPDHYSEQLVIIEGTKCGSPRV